MASSINDVPNKYESPYDLTQSLDTQPSLKRRRSEDVHNGDKRQKIEMEFDSMTYDDRPNLHSTDPTNGQYTTNTYYTSDHPIPIDSTNQSISTIWDPHLNMRIHSLNILESLSIQILATLAQGPWEETIRIITEPEKELGQAYTTMKSLFDQTKKIYTQQDVFLSADKLNLEEDTQREIVRTTNLATFVSGVFAGDVGFYELNDHFLETFVPVGDSLSGEQGQLFLNLKTQVYISALSQEEQERTSEETVYEMFPDDIEILLNMRHPEKGLSQTEKNFIEDLKRRREYLINESRDVESIQRLSNQYGWEDFLRSLSEYLRKAYAPLIAPYMKRHPSADPGSAAQSVDSKTMNSNNDNRTHTINNDDFALEAEREIQKALQSFANQHNAGNSDQQNGDSVQIQNGQRPEHYKGQTIPQPPDQSEPTQVLYEKARQATIAKSTNPGSARRPGLPSQRRPWSQEEESALMAGLDLVKGPHWSQILALYGPEGSVNHVLKDRNQVQLKDKARNLKLFFLKSNTEVPHYLQAVTGELKTRAPSQAAKKEAEERARLASADEQMRVSGIMALSSIKDQSQSNGRVDKSLSPASDDTLSSQDLDYEEGFDADESKKHGSKSPQTTADERLRQQLSAHNNRP